MTENGTDTRMDWPRLARTGTAEAVLCEPKSLAQIEAILTTASEERRDLLLTRLSPQRQAALAARFPDLTVEPQGGTAVLRASKAEPPIPIDGVGIVTAGTSDLPTAYEAAATLRFHGYAAPILADLGVAGLWRLMERLDEVRAFRVVIAIAGMEGALFSVLTGLVEAPVIAVPTATGYGIGADGTVALHAALAGCAAGVTAVNVGNGFGAACTAIRILRMIKR